ncbi:mitochondrial genome maintenance protein [Moniliophthora roreri MCA 2997]|uniref:Mitochondrial genome maintenance protein n=2 Tax=Moniliophthora roreri TaxID=221103 RepID=V2X594_MONRO|nr:mitochondrial genome maintenance protein [Moniliophthora roreri MCA 2997]KAI3615495.1 mitochondrial genome maintenance protein [Moniliophthora roreri]
MGALMGGGVGLTIGFIFGSWSIIRHGPGPRGALSTLSQYMLSSAATFGFFLSIGSVIRSDSTISPQLQAARMQLLTPAMAIRTRAEGRELMKVRWAEEK